MHPMCTTQTSPNLQESGICDEFKQDMRKTEGIEAAQDLTN